MEDLRMQLQAVVDAATEKYKEMMHAGDQEIQIRYDSIPYSFNADSDPSIWMHATPKKRFSDYLQENPLRFSFNLVLPIREKRIEIKYWNEYEMGLASVLSIAAEAQASYKEEIAVNVLHQLIEAAQLIMGLMIPPMKLLHADSKEKEFPLPSTMSVIEQTLRIMQNIPRKGPYPCCNIDLNEHAYADERFKQMKYSEAKLAMENAASARKEA